MNRRIISLVFVLTLSLALFSPAYANPGQPNFGPGLWADGEVWGTKGAAGLPDASANNMQSFDKLFVITNSNNPAGQMPVAEAAPGNPMYNGGRWYTHTVSWTASGFAAHGTVPVLTSYMDVMYHYGLGHLSITPGSFAGGPPNFFECPLLPVM